MASIRQLRGTRAALDAKAVSGTLQSGEIYLITDEDRLAIGTSATAYTAYAKEGEASASIEAITLNLTAQSQHHEQILSRPGTLPTQSVRAWLASSDDNEIWQLEMVAINAVCETDQITFYLSCQYFESGDININFEVK